MKKILIFMATCLLCTHPSYGAVRDGNASARAKNQPTNQRISSTTKTERAGGRTTVLTPRSATRKSTSRPSVARATSTPTLATARPSTNQSPVPRNLVARATTTESTPVDLTTTRTGAEYEKCKETYFTCMDQFCGLKNDDYRRCSCSNRVYELQEHRDTLTQAGEQLSIFTENLDVVGLTSAQANAMISASEGENALTSDISASKALLNAIMNSIRGEDSTVGGKYSDLNSITISFDTINAFGTVDAGQAVAAYNGQNLYEAVYPSCRNAVRADCNDASLQRAITAYLMAIEQDCNTVQTAIVEKQKKLKSAIREGSAMLDLARVENRQKHNSSDMTTCLNEVESAILSEQVCGENYHKCLDNGEYIDVATGKPITGITDFYKLEKMLTFADGVEASKQKLSKINSNRAFVENFQAKTLKFAEDALDKCVEIRDDVWSAYLDKALLDIYYAQRAKVEEIRQGCFDFVSACYMNGEQSITTAMKELTGETAITLQPDSLALNKAMCTEYVQSCNNMFADNIIQEYINNRHETDNLTACRAVARQCLDKFGGTTYENYYYPYSGIFTPGQGNAPDWFTLYEIKPGVTCNTADGWMNGSTVNFSFDGKEPFGYPGTCVRYVSECAKQLKTIASCSDPYTIERAFGGFDKMWVTIDNSDTSTYEDDPDPTTKGEHGNIKYNIDGTKYVLASEGTVGATIKYGLLMDMMDTEQLQLAHRVTRPSGVGTEVHNQVLDILTTQCMNLQGRFVELQHLNNSFYNGSCAINTENFISQGIVTLYGIKNKENMCPRNYQLTVDTPSWGVCSCWENGGRRSKWGQSAKCIAGFAVESTVNDKGETVYVNDAQCAEGAVLLENLSITTPVESWCTQQYIDKDNRVCPLETTGKTEDGKCNYTFDDNELPMGLKQ